MSDFNDFLNTVRRASVHAPYQFLRSPGGLGPDRIASAVKFKYLEYRDNPYFFKPCGTLIFCGSQGEGKTLSAVIYILQLLQQYPMAILVTNTRIKGRPFNAYIYHDDISDSDLRAEYATVRDQRYKDFYNGIIAELTEDFYLIKAPETTLEEYLIFNLPFYPFNESDDFEDFKQSKVWQLRDVFTDQIITPDKIIDGTFKNVTIQYWGLDTLKYVNNGNLGVVFFIDEIHLELNSLESKNVPIEIMVEISQQRKQRKHIIGTSQRYNRMSKPLREQIRDIVICRCFFGCIQYNRLIDGDSTEEKDGTLKYDIKHRTLWFHSADMYRAYDTYAKMRRYNNEWQGRPQMFSLEGYQIE